MTGSGDRVWLLVLTPEQVLFDGSVRWAQIPLEDGFLGVYPEHAPLIASVGGGTLRYLTESGEEALSPGPGVLVIDETHCVLLLAEPGERAAEDREQLVDEMEAALREVIGDSVLESIQETGE
ncbi:MAG: hypothetical protein GXX94_10310 [Chloroflexi bacterium]|nr:hypothetical protein [Chloroflexota bacterium]